MVMDAQKFLEDARRATDRRMAAAETIASALSAREEARAVLTERTADVEAAFKAAEQAGWSKTELRRLRPSDMTTKERATRSRRRPTATHEPATEGNAESGPADVAN